VQLKILKKFLEKIWGETGPPYINGDMFKFPEKIDISKKGVNSEKKFLEKF